MKKIKFLGAAILAASLIFAGCANGSDDDVDSTPDTEKVVDEKGGEGSEENGGSESGSGEEAGGEENSGEGQNSGSGESSGSGDSGSSSGGDTEAGDTDGGDTDDGDTEAEDGDDEDTDDPITEEDLMNPDLSYSTLTVYGAEENDLNLGGTQNWWNGPAFSEENNEIVVNFGHPEGSGAYTISFNVVDDDIITVEYKSEVPAQLRFVTENSNGQKKECNVNAVASDDYTKVSYKFAEDEAGKLIQIGFIGAGETGKLNVKSITLKAVDTSDSLSAIISGVEAYLDTVTVGSAVGNFPQDAVDVLETAIATAKAEITAKANRKEWFAAENALEAALESFKANQVKPTFPETGHNVEGATYIYTSTDEANSKIANINPGWGQASAQGFEEVTVGETTRKIIVLNLVNYQGMDINNIDISNATKLCFEYNTTDASTTINVSPIYAHEPDPAKEYPISWSPVADGQWHTAEIIFDKNNPNSSDVINQIKFADGTGKIYYDNLRVE